MKLLKKYLFLILFCIVPNIAIAQDDFETWLKGQQKEYTSFLEERDKEFHSFLKGQWKNFDVKEGEKEDKTPKPVEIPTAPKVVKKPEPKPIKPEKIEKVEKKKEPVSTPLKIPKPMVNKSVKVMFFGEKLIFPKIEGLDSLRLKSVNKDGIAGFWADFASSNVKPVIHQLKYYKSKKRLNGWGLFLLTGEFSKEMIKDKNASLLLTWALMLKSGYDLRVGFSGSEVKILFTSNDDLYSIPFFSLQGKRYYLFDDDSRSIKSYDASYEGANKTINVFFVKRPLFITEKVGRKELYFEYRKKEYMIEAYFNPHLIEYMKTLPQFSLEKYFMGEPDYLISKYFAESVKEKVKDLSDYEKVNFILRFVQKAFPYKTDDEQFAREKYFYPEEMIYYPYSDCEDRSVIFSYLVKKITGFDAVILDYPGHVATAVNIPGNVEGDYVVVDGKRYYISDPTYINADAGMTMPGYENKNPRIISVE